MSQDCSLLRRLLAIFYDLILLSSVLFLATLVILPLNKGHAIESGNLLYFFYLLLCSYFYFAWQWRHGGRTLGMRTWRIRLVKTDMGSPDWQAVTKRFVLACLSSLVLGMGFLWALFDPQKLTFHDRYSKTFLIKEGPSTG